MSNTFSSHHPPESIVLDNQAPPPWAVEEYGSKERRTLQCMFNAMGPLAGLRILESGCGTGLLTMELARQAGPNGCIVAMDTSPQMIAAARQRLAGFGNVKIYLGAAETRARSLGRFDQVICRQEYSQFIDQGKALSTLTNLLNPLGIIIISHLSSFADIKDNNRKAEVAASRKMMPDTSQMRVFCKACGLKIEKWQDDQEGYLLCARRI